MNKQSWFAIFAMLTTAACVVEEQGVVAEEDAPPITASPRLDTDASVEVLPELEAVPDSTYCDWYGDCFYCESRVRMWDCTMVTYSWSCYGDSGASSYIDCNYWI